MRSTNLEKCEVEFKSFLTELITQKVFAVERFCVTTLLPSFKSDLTEMT